MLWVRNKQRVFVVQSKKDHLEFLAPGVVWKERDRMFGDGMYCKTYTEEDRFQCHG